MSGEGFHSCAALPRVIQTELVLLCNLRLRHFAPTCWTRKNLNETETTR
jgi:hypothetical protein